jgi:hypothetical protein
VLVLCLLLIAGGCSYGLKRPPQSALPRGVPVTCETSRVAPWLDLVASAAVAAGGVALIAGSPGCPSDADECIGPGIERVYRTAGGLALFGVATAVFISSVRGFDWTGTCRELKDKERLCSEGDRWACADPYDPRDAARVSAEE